MVSLKSLVPVSVLLIYPIFCWIGLGAILLGFCLRQTVCLRLP